MLSPAGRLAFERPEALLLALAVIPIIVLYFLRMRFRRKPVGSTFIWRELVAATSGGDALRRRSLLLLLLQVAAVALAAFAAAGPSIDSRLLLRPGTVFLVDVSASMATRDEGGTSRVDAAIAAVKRELSALGDDVPVMAFACASSARGLLAEPTLDKAAAAAALRSLKAGSEAFSEAGCADAASAWLARSEGNWQACLVTDGGLDLGGRAIAAAFSGSLRVIPVGSPGSSVGATGLRLADEGSGLVARFTLWNGAQDERAVKVRITRGKEELASGAVPAAPGWSRASLGMRGSLEDGAYALSVERGPKDLGSAPGASYRLAVNRQRALRVLLVGRVDPFLKAALAYGGISYASSAAFPSTPVRADIVISESSGEPRSPVPAGARFNLLALGLPPPDAPVVAAGRASGKIVSTLPSHPLSRFVDWEGAEASAGIAYSPRSRTELGDALTLATAGSSPVLVAWEREGYRGLACGIDLARSDLGLKSAFPVLLQNFFQWCVPRVDEQTAFTLVAGEGARRAPALAVGDSADGAPFKAEGVEVSLSGPAVILMAREAGFFKWEAGGSRGYIAANVPPGELDVAPRAVQAEVGAPGAAVSSLASTAQSRSAPLGGWAILLLAACLAAEWIAWKGAGSPRRRGEGAKS